MRVVDIRSHRLACSLIVLLLTACSQVRATPSEDTTRVQTHYKDLPARLCLRIEPSSWTSLTGGTTRLALHIQNGVASGRYSPTFFIRLLDANGKAQRNIDVFTMTADPEPSAGQMPAPQNFLLNLHDVLAGTKPISELRIEVDIDRSDPQMALLAERGVVISASWQPVGK